MVVPATDGFVVIPATDGFVVIPATDGFVVIPATDGFVVIPATDGFVVIPATDGFVVIPATDGFVVIPAPPKLCLFRCNSPLAGQFAKQIEKILSECKTFSINHSEKIKGQASQFPPPKCGGQGMVWNGKWNGKEFLV